MADFCIVAVTFDRPNSLARLIASLLRADYGEDAVDLLVSVDGGPRSDGMIEAVGALDWPHGKCTLRRMPENLGLRRHILHCGDEAKNYGAIIMLEDDIVVGPGFYQYAKWAAEQYGSDSRVAGISLYAPLFNEMAGLPFAPSHSSHSAYALQSAQSWGQCWTRSMWRRFALWYAAQSGSLKHADDMPERIYSWPESSWKKFAMKYLAETGKTWIYPYLSHSTNCSEIGTHNRHRSALFQVPLAASGIVYTAAALDQLVQYDIYFERINAPLAKCAALDIAGQTETGPHRLVLDLYGTRQSLTGPARLLTVRKLPKVPLASFGLHFKPHEANAELGTPGEVARLYDIGASETVNLLNFGRIRAASFYSGMDWRDNLKAGFQGLKSAVERRLLK